MTTSPAVGPPTVVRCPLRERSAACDPGPVPSVLFVHPSGHANDWVVPAGAIAALNATPRDKVGRYAFELDDDLVRSARILAVDLHWALGFPGFEALVHHVRRVAPELPIVAGGITAGLWAERLLALGLSDFVIQGDAEVAFPRLVAALLENASAPDLPNVHRRGHAAPRIERISSLDESDSVRAEWFPTYERARQSSMRAFSADRLLVAARGCPLACPDCHGSWAGSFGSGVLWRSASALARQAEDAARTGTRHLRVFMGKPSRSTLHEWLEALSRAEVGGVRSDIGIMLCRAPSVEALVAFQRTASTRLAISVVDPFEHQPTTPTRAAAEWSEWLEIAETAAVELDVWTSNPERVAPLRADLAGTRARVSYSGYWDSPRPKHATAPHDFDSVRAAVAPFWTFYAAKLLSPSLARLLAPLALLDDLDTPDPRPDDHPLRPMVDDAYANFARTRLPTLPSLGFSAVPVTGAARATAFGDVHLRGDAVVLAGARRMGPRADLAAASDHRGILLSARLEAPAATDFIALLPRGAELDALEDDGVLALRVPAGDRLDLRVRLALGSAWLTLSGSAESTRGFATLGLASGLELPDEL